MGTIGRIALGICPVGIRDEIGGCHGAAHGGKGIRGDVDRGDVLILWGLCILRPVLDGLGIPKAGVGR